MVKPIKALGQNFLTNPHKIKTMLDALELQTCDLVVEIGPGEGALTVPLAEMLTKAKGELLCIEIDARLAQALTTRFKASHTVQIVNANFLEWITTFNPGRPYKLIGSLPYYITSPIIHALIKASTSPTTAVLMVQKEVTDKIAATEPDNSYLSVFIQTFYSVEIVEYIDKHDFNPVPKVDSAIIKLTKKACPFDVGQIARYEGFLHRAFANPRKMLNKAFNPIMLKQHAIDPTLRPQNLSVAQWVKFFEGNQTI